MARPTIEDLEKMEHALAEIDPMERAGYKIAHVLAWAEGKAGPSNPDTAGQPPTAAPAE